MLSKITRRLYNLARASNKLRIISKLLEGNPKPILKHLRNRLYFRLGGRFLK